MLTCPNPPCRKPVPAGVRECPRCRTDLSLLVAYVDDLQGGLERAEALTRAGELGPAVWAYLSVLEVDPDNATARRQVGQVAATVRQFDRAAARRRWLRRLQKHARFRQWLVGEGPRLLPGWLLALIGIVLVLAALGIGYALGSRDASAARGEESAAPAQGAEGPNAARNRGERESARKPLTGRAAVL